MFLKVGPAHGTVSPVSHPHGNMFLNSPHGQFTDTFNKIGTAKKGLGYGSKFMDWGEAANTGNGCTGCHDPHESLVDKTSPGPAIREESECMSCHSSLDPAKVAAIPQVNLSIINHIGGTPGDGTPLQDKSTKPNEACVTCHMPGGLHMLRINPSASYSTYPMPAALSGTVNANTAADGSFANAVWVDVDLACGQCHGAGPIKQLQRVTLLLEAQACSSPVQWALWPARKSRSWTRARWNDDTPPGTGPSDFETYVFRFRMLPTSTWQGGNL